ncbi:hypothetical protein SUGI_1015380 [Cryptomeria japonica]|uniref:GDSL esterase/lipase At5g63170 n=1 Tax=Cryptomeria japonica TaxID=3369 RepID=UPI002414800E|nr:GDSL esterase/lipase At5g63170 [Cryptomeria japonica]GLJ48092.1 hypothetical protein SUGI_1015380 [Cryptomeria japonica]
MAIHLGLLCASAILAVLVCVAAQGGSSRFPAIMVFGDSTLDPGNNNNINTPAKANFPPYGRDFPGRIPTGRFTNGKLSSDYLASALGIKDLVPAYLDRSLSSNDLLTGVSFASAGSGYDNMTAESGNVIALWKQVQYFREYISRITSIVGAERASSIVSNSLYYLAAGNADWGVSYFFNIGNAQNNRAMNYTIPQYTDLLINSGLGTITDLYNAGARKFIVAGLSILGCSPSERTFLAVAGRPCNARINDASAYFNRHWAPALSNLESSLPGSTIVYSDIYDIVVDAVAYPFRYGFIDPTRGCCGTGLVEVGRDCARAAAISCPDASRFLWWDSVHPTSAMYEIIANLVMQRDVPRLP